MNDTAKPSRKLFWGCFIALITTSFGFIGRMFLLDDPAVTQDLLGLDPAEVGKFRGIQIWPFAVSIIIFSLIIDKVGYKFSMIFAFVCQFLWAIMGVAGLYIGQSNPELASGLIYWGGLVLALGNGTVEAFINPVVATMFDKEKTKWLNILHAGWPGGLVIAGIITICLTAAGMPWTIKLGIIAIPAVVYFIMLIGCNFPVQERVSAGVSYRDMLSEFGTVGAAIVSGLIYLQLRDFFPDVNHIFFAILCVAMVVAFALYTRSIGRPLMIVLILIMMPLATTEIGTDGWITNIMAGAVSFDAGWILVYTSVIMMVLRFFAGPIVHKLSPLGLLVVSAVLAIAGLIALSGAAGVFIIFGAATLYALGKTFFWPTMLGVVSEQMPKGGALTLNAISGIGMLAVGLLGFPLIGALQVKSENAALLAEENAAAVEAVDGFVKDGKIQTIEEKSLYVVIKYDAIDEGGLGALLDTKLPAALQTVRTQLTSVSDAFGVPSGETDEEKAASEKKIADAKAAAPTSLDALTAYIASTGAPDPEEGASDEDVKAALTKFDDDKKAATEAVAPIKAAVGKADADVALALGSLTGFVGGQLDSNPDRKAVSKPIEDVRGGSKQKALLDMALFPGLMLIAYIGLFFYFKSKGGYKPVEVG